MTLRSVVRTASACLAVAMVFNFVGAAHAEFTTVWQAGVPGRAWPVDGVGGGPDVDFIQEAGTNPPPGNPNSPSLAQQADDDYYFAGTYPAPIGTVPVEKAFERAFANTDNDLRIHFNLPDDLDPLDTFRFSFEANNLHDDGGDTRYGIEVSFNQVVIFPELTIKPADLNTVITSDVFTAGSVDAVGGAGFDNVVLVRGINHNADGGGNWMGMDFHHLEREPTEIPEPSTLLLISLGGLLLLPVLKRRRMANQA